MTKRVFGYLIILCLLIALGSGVILAVSTNEDLKTAAGLILLVALGASCYSGIRRIVG